MLGRWPPNITAAAPMPASSPPSTAIAGCPPELKAATMPSPAFRLPPPSDSAVAPDPDSAFAPTKIVGTASPSLLPIRATGMFIAEVSYPSRAATLAAAASSPAVGCSASTIRALTKSTAPSLLRSWKTTPGLKKSASAAAEAADDCVRPTAPVTLAATRIKKKRFIPPIRKRQPRRHEDTKNKRSSSCFRAFVSSELESDRELRLPRRVVEVREWRRARSNQRPPRRGVVAGADVGRRRREIDAVEDVEQLRDQLGARRTADAEELREPQIDVREARTIDL